MLDRRTFVLSTASAAALAMAARPGAALAQRSPGPEARALNALMERGYQELVLSDPETRTSLGLDTGLHAGAKAQLLDRSPAALRARQQQLRRFNTDLLAIDRGS